MFSLSIRSLGVFGVACCAALTTFAQSENPAGSLRLPALFSHHMVLQQGTEVPVWGWANDGTVVTVKFGGQKITTVTHNKKWTVNLRKLKASDRPAVLTIATADQTIALTNVLVGEVWICSGQSNMEWPMEKAFEPEKDIASATNRVIRLFKVPNAISVLPRVDTKGKWETLSPASVKDFSAVGYYFSRDLQAARHVPVGMIEADWGGTPAESWTSPEGMDLEPRYRKEFVDSQAELSKKHEIAFAAWQKEKAEAEAKKEKFTRWMPWRPWAPSELYNAMIAPLVPYAIKGAIWYQGENNAGRAEQYRALFPDMIRSWRRAWGYDFTFVAVQLAPFKKIQPQPMESDWAELREAQWLATKELPKVGLAVITDVGEQFDIHPRKKGPVGSRLALSARDLAYGEKIFSSGPQYDRMVVEGNKIRLYFTDKGTGLVARDGALKGFAICGADKKFVWAQAEIQPDNSVLVSSPDVSQPVAVRFGWADYPEVNLWNQQGLPAAPFRTDDFPMLTQGKTER